MKPKIALTLLMLISFTAFGDGGGSGSSFSINSLEINFNLYYQSVQTEVTIPGKKGKTETYSVTHNMAIYNVKTKNTTYLFADTCKEDIRYVYYESHYDSLNRKMLFNVNENETYPDSRITGNMQLTKRAPSENLVIITYSYRTLRYTLWTAHKTGRDLKRVYEFGGEEFYLDATNRVIRFVKEGNKKVEIKDAGY